MKEKQFKPFDVWRIKLGKPVIEFRVLKEEICSDADDVDGSLWYISRENKGAKKSYCYWRSAIANPCTSAKMALEEHLKSYEESLVSMIEEQEELSQMIDDQRRVIEQIKVAIIEVA